MSDEMKSGLRREITPDDLETLFNGGKPLCESWSETTEQDHHHVCPVCGDGWIHANDECDAELVAVPDVPLAHTWARCPVHEGRDE
jgi:predicted RNA-binding Zn-ribbon protein involved in translation (DUF1610 family)